MDKQQKLINEARLLILSAQSLHPLFTTLLEKAGFNRELLKLIAIMNGGRNNFSVLSNVFSPIKITSEYNGLILPWPRTSEAEQVSAVTASLIQLSDQGFPVGLVFPVDYASGYTRVITPTRKSIQRINTIADVGNTMVQLIVATAEI